jgi:hypothetical protein
MRWKCPDLAIYREIAEFNREFVCLLIHPAAPVHDGLFGLRLEWLQALRLQTAHQQECIGHVPCLLIDLEPPPSEARGITESPVILVHDPIWEEQVKVFTSGVLTYLWRVVRTDPLAARLCLGVRPGVLEKLAVMNLREIREFSAMAPVELKARFTSSPRFWPDLVRAGRDADPDRAMVARLAALPLLVAQAERD